MSLYYDPFPDPIEQLEAWEERMIERYGNLDGSFQCAGCGCTIPIGHCRQAGVAPYGVPVCEDCYNRDRIEDEW